MRLIDNGLHSMQRALETLFKLDDWHRTKEIEYELKDIIINFHHALETLFKLLIEQKSEYLIYEKLKDHFEDIAKKKIKKVEESIKIKILLKQ